MTREYWIVEYGNGTLAPKFHFCETQAEVPAIVRKYEAAGYTVRYWQL